MIHVVSGHNFHGQYEVRFRGPNRAFLLSASQARRYRHTLCPNRDCLCRGKYGEGPSREGAHVQWAFEYTSSELRNLGLGEAEIQRVRNEDPALILIPADDCS